MRPIQVVRDAALEPSFLRRRTHLTLVPWWREAQLHSIPLRRIEARNIFTALKIIVAQLLVTVVIAIGLLLWTGQHAAYSAGVGGCVSAVASLYFASRVFRKDGTASPERLLRSLYVGEAVKILMTVALFVVAIVMFDVDILFMLLAYAATLPVYWLSLLLADGSEG